MRTRRGYAWAALLLLAVEILIALFVDDRFVRPFVGDVLAVLLVHCALRAATAWRWPVALAAALAVAVAVELGQLLGLLPLLGLEDVAVARVVLGSGFDPLDFAAYALGGLIAAVAEGARGR